MADNRPILAVLVPVLNRPQNVAPLVESWRATRANLYHPLIFLVGSDDHAEWDAITEHAPDCDFITVQPGYESWPHKINTGVRNYRADWYLCAADDIAFTPGWWEATKALRDDPQVGVIGTNDSRDGTGNPRVAAGEHTCHPLIRASYIRDHGTIDEPGKAVHDSYYHWCVDDELIWTAKIRGAWAFCRDAVIEHLHPYWGKAQWDDTYTLGEAHAQEDLELWKDRAVRLLGLQLA